MNLPNMLDAKRRTSNKTIIKYDDYVMNSEIKEESVKYYGTFEAQAHGKAEGILVRMTCYTAEWDGEIAPSAEIQEIRRLSYSDIDIVSPVDKLIFEDLKTKNYLE